MHSFFTRSLALAAVAGCAAHAQAQSSLPPVTVTGNPLGAGELVAPASQLSGSALLLRSQGTLGETLDRQPGVSSTYFGPAASRPVIRGLDGDRIRVLSNGSGALDASSLSYDHAVAADPITVERIEVLRGPAALLYGGSAIGGVVNLIDNRIPRRPPGAMLGVLDAGHASGSREGSVAALLEGGGAAFGWHVDVFRRDAIAARVPLALPCAGAVARRICNSDAEAEGGAMGGSVFFADGYLGLSASDHRSDYGSVAEEEVRIGLRSRRYAMEGEWRAGAGLLRSLHWKAGHTDYGHTEFDAGLAGTVFGLRGNELRIEARHAPLGGFEGIVGWQSERTRFLADGDEAFAPPSRTRTDALFGYEELVRPWGKWTFGARAEQVRVASLGSADAVRFPVTERRFTAWSAAAGARWKLAPSWEATAQFARSQRAPKDYELFANGPHVATGAWERGDARLGIETARQADVGVEFRRGAHSARLAAFETRFDNYIALLRTGGEVETDDGEALPEYAYRAVRARLRGFEAEARLRLAEGATPLDLELRGDRVRGENRSSGEPLPRMAPWRAGATLVAAHGAWGARLGFDRHGRQPRVPAGDLPVAGYTLWHASLTWRVDAPAAQWLWYLRVDNAADKLAYSATSILTQSAPQRVPLPGRSVKLGMRATF
jgi:iron complex outermembrane receptor protein